MPDFDVVLADPPWRYSFSQSGTRRIENHYPTMSVDELKALGSRLPIAKDAVLFLWATAPKLIEALAVLHAWRFEYKTQAVWDKQIIGMGYWFRGRHELILVGTRGSFAPPDACNRIPSVLIGRRSAHSRKPVEFREWIDRAFPRGRKLELFAREAPPGWAIWGNEVSSTISLGRPRRPAQGARRAPPRA